MPLQWSFDTNGANSVGSNEDRSKLIRLCIFSNILRCFCIGYLGALYSSIIIGCLHVGWGSSWAVWCRLDYDCIRNWSSPSGFCKLFPFLPPWAISLGSCLHQALGVAVHWDEMSLQGRAGPAGISSSQSLCPPPSPSGRKGGKGQ